jgi:hypothetical protein
VAGREITGIASFKPAMVAKSRMWSETSRYLIYLLELTRWIHRWKCNNRIILCVYLLSICTGGARARPTWALAPPCHSLSSSHRLIVNVQFLFFFQF